MATYFDSHAHLTADEVYPQIDALLQRAAAAQVSGIVNICTDLTTLERGIALHQHNSWVYNAAATTPHDVDRFGEAHFDKIATSAHAGELVAVGETGLDYYYTHSKRETQQHFLKRYLHLARDCALPVIIHCREAFSDLFAMLDKEYQGGGVFHCFTGTLEEAKKVVERGFYLSLSGIVTFRKSDLLREVAAWTPLDHLLIETDTPYLAPLPYRGASNEPAYIVETARIIADIKRISLEELALSTKINATRLFSL
jgi:TatD DNase family protein